MPKILPARSCKAISALYKTESPRAFVGCYFNKRNISQSIKSSGRLAFFPCRRGYLVMTENCSTLVIVYSDKLIVFILSLPFHQIKLFFIFIYCLYRIMSKRNGNFFSKKRQPCRYIISVCFVHSYYVFFSVL